MKALAPRRRAWQLIQLSNRCNIFMSWAFCRRSLLAKFPRRILISPSRRLISSGMVPATGEFCKAATGASTWVARRLRLANAAFAFGGSYACEPPLSFTTSELPVSNVPSRPASSDGSRAADRSNCGGFSVEPAIANPSVFTSSFGSFSCFCWRRGDTRLARNFHGDAIHSTSRFIPACRLRVHVLAAALAATRILVLKNMKMPPAIGPAINRASAAFADQRFQREAFRPAACAAFGFLLPAEADPPSPQPPPARQVPPAPPSGHAS